MSFFKTIIASMIGAYVAFALVLTLNYEFVNDAKVVVKMLRNESLTRKELTKTLDGLNVAVHRATVLLDNYMVAHAKELINISLTIKKIANEVNILKNTTQDNKPEMKKHKKEH